jgi:ferrochelatase
MKWLGPDLKTTLEALASRGRKHVVLAPIGFLADHVEILYDLDIEAKAWGDELGIVTYRSASLNAGDGLLSALEAVARRAL